MTTHTDPAHKLIDDLEYAVLARAQGFPGTAVRLSEAKSAIRAALAAAPEPDHVDQPQSVAVSGDTGRDAKPWREAYDSIDRFLRNNLDDSDYAAYSDELEIVLAAGAAPSAGQWVPIDSAPQGGRLLLRVPTTWGKRTPHIVCEGFWLHDSWAIVNGDESVQRVAPTHWTPLPASPVSVQPDPVPPTAQELAALQRFRETCEDADSGGYDVPKPMMNRLACIGFVRRLKGSTYEVTALGFGALNGDAAAPGAGQPDYGAMWDRFIAAYSAELGVPTRNLIGGAAAFRKQFIAAQDGQQPDPLSLSECARLPDATALICRAVAQLTAWHEKYGANTPKWLPVAGDVRWLEDASGYLSAQDKPAAPAAPAAPAEQCCDGHCTGLEHQPGCVRAASATPAHQETKL